VNRKSIIRGWTVAWALAGISAMLAAASGAAADFAKKSPLTLGYSIQSAQDPYW
jgi:ABC-type sugar transport system substrate-binding protein